jgi:hypothetical protein
MDLMMQTSVKGALFTKGKRLTEDFNEKIITTLVELGEERLSQTLRPQGFRRALTPTNTKGVFKTAMEAGDQASTGHYRRSVNSEIQGSIARIDDSGVVYGPWLEGISSRNSTTRFKGYFQFRLTSQFLNLISEKVGNNLKKMYVRKMNGI